MTAPPVLGRVVATERKPNTPHEFSFWTALDSPVGIGTIVRVEGPDPVNGVIPRVFGVVTEGFSYTDLQTPLHDVLGHDGRPSAESLSATRRTEIRLYSAAVLRHLPEEPLQPVPMGEVYLADADDVAVALRMDGYLAAGAHTGIPVGDLPGGRHRGADLSRCRFPRRPRSGAPEHHRRVGARHEDERHRVAAARRCSRTSPSRRGRWPRCAST